MNFSPIGTVLRTSMTRREFIDSKRRWDWFIVLPAYAALLVLVASPFLWMGFQARQPDMSLLARIAGGTACLGVLVLVVWFVYCCLPRIEEKRFRHRCPSCDKGFAAT